MTAPDARAETGRGARPVDGEANEPFAAMRHAIDDLKKRPCTCVLCGDCNGTGDIQVDDKFQPEGWDLETCEQCDGGISEVCERCLELDEIYEQLEEMEWSKRP